MLSAGKGLSLSKGIDSGITGFFLNNTLVALSTISYYH